MKYMLYVQAKSIQSCPILCDPMDCSPQAPLSMGFSRLEYFSELLCPPPGDLPNPETEPISLTSPALADEVFTTSATWEAHLSSMLSHFSYFDQLIVHCLTANLSTCVLNCNLLTSLLHHHPFSFS